MATQQISPAPHALAASPPYPMATPGYGKRSAPGQLPRRADDFALLPTRERYVAGFVDHLPEGAAMSVKTLAKQLPLYGQQAVSTSLTALSVAGHLRRVRCAVGQGDTTRWAFRTFWSRTARDNEWWNTYLATESTRDAAPAPAVTAPSTTAAAPPPPWDPAENPPPPAPPEAPRGEPDRQTAQFPRADAAPAAPEAAAAPAAPVPAPAPAAAPTVSAPAAVRSPAYLALARLGRTDHRLGLSAADCAALETLADEWLARGVDAGYLTAVLTAGLPAQVDSPVGFVRRRLTDKIPPRLPAETAAPGAPTHRILVECTECRVPGRPEALPDGLCRPCRAAHRPGATGSPDGSAAAPAGGRDIGAYVSELRDLLKAP
ncbi:MarR family transcriptional regulator [Streptomyces anulatus]|uniref:MarR family transcriptional regulator n=1 Tax=Streptomyces anulatus TaxID=1892 RepID=UPI0013B82F0A|nr:MarR family transcriptional regulator [Streptomyces anulatus]NDZ58328.1 MarR family transcriptional regulator [Streptomyces anulatus]